MRHAAAIRGHLAGRSRPAAGRGIRDLGGAWVFLISGLSWVLAGAELSGRLRPFCWGGVVDYLREREGWAMRCGAVGSGPFGRPARGCGPFFCRLGWSCPAWLSWGHRAVLGCSGPGSPRPARSGWPGLAQRPRAPAGPGSHTGAWVRGNEGGRVLGRPQPPLAAAGGHGLAWGGLQAGAGALLVA